MAESQSEIVIDLAEEFLERYRRGERPPLKEYVDRHPALAADIREVFPAMAMMENIALADESMERTGAVLKTSEIAVRQLGDYRILRQIGQGGMGTVYEAEQVSLGRHVALKLLPQKMVLDAKQKRRFEREARAAARLHHTNIVPVFGVGEEDGLPYYVMQFIQGQGLDLVLEELRRLEKPSSAGSAIPRSVPQDAPGLDQPPANKRVSAGDITAADVARSLWQGEFGPGSDSDAGAAPRAPGTVNMPAHGPDSSVAKPPATAPLPRDSSPSSSSIILPGSSNSNTKGKSLRQTYWHGIAHLGVQVADALDYAHKQGILHRDIKPSNLLLDNRGIVWVTDFGLAKADDQQNLTQTGDILGTLRYMPPEAFEGKSDARGDIYSLGLTLFEMLALEPAYNEKDRNQLVKQMTGHDSPRLDWRNSAIPRDLVTIVHKAIDRDPSARYQTASVLAADLQRFLDDEPIQARRVSTTERFRRWCRHNPGLATFSAATFALLLLIAVGASVAALWLQGSLADTEAQRNRAVGAEKDAADERDTAQKNAALAKKNEIRAKQAERDALKRLGEARLAQALANRLSGRQGQRFESLQAIREAVKILGPTLELRNAALACLVLPDIASKRELPGAPGLIASAVFDQSLERYARWDSEGKVNICRVSDDAPLMDLPAQGSISEYSGTGFSPDGKYFAQASTQRLKVWRIDGLQPEEKLDVVGNFGVDFRHDRPQIATVLRNSSGETRIYDLVEGKEVRRLPFQSLPFHPRLPHLPCFQGQTFRILDVDTGKTVAQWPLPPGSIEMLSWHPQGKLLAISLSDKKIYLYDAASGRLALPPLVGHTNHGIIHSFSQHGDVLLSNDWSIVLRLWDTQTGRQIFNTPANTLVKGHFAADDRLFAGTIQANKLRIMRVALGRELRTLLRHTQAEKSHYHETLVSPDGRWLAVNTRDGLALVDLTSGAELAWQSLGNTRAIGFDAKGALLTTGFGGLRRWPIHHEAAQNRLRVGPPEIILAEDTVVCASGDRKVLGILSYDSKGELVYRRDRLMQPLTLGLQNDVRFAALSPNGKWVASGSHGLGGVIVWDTATGRKEATLFPQGGVPGFSPDGKWLAAFSYLGDDCRLWQVGSWKPGPQIDGNHFVFSPDSSLIAVESGFGVVRLVRIADGQEIARLQTPEQTRLIPQCFTPDGAQLITWGHESQALHIFDLRALRAQLKELRLDWDAPAYPPALPPRPPLKAFFAAPPTFPLLYQFGQNMRFGLTAVDELGQRRSITYRQDGDTNHALLRLDGKEVEFGGTAGLWDPQEEPLEPGLAGKKRVGHRSVWKLPTLHVSQIVELTGPDRKTCLVKYVFENKGEKPLNVGLRLLIDTMIGDNDGHPFALPGKDERITTSADWKGEELPPRVLALEKLNPKDPGLTAVFNLKVGGGLEPPDRCSLTHWPTDKKAPGWFIPVRPVADDAAVVLYWNARDLAAGARREIAFAVGTTELAPENKNKE